MREPSVWVIIQIDCILCFKPLNNEVKGVEVLCFLRKKFKSLKDSYCNKFSLNARLFFSSIICSVITPVIIVNVPLMVSFNNLFFYQAGEYMDSYKCKGTFISCDRWVLNAVPGWYTYTLPCPDDPQAYCDIAVVSLLRSRTQKRRKQLCH